MNEGLIYVKIYLQKNEGETFGKNYYSIIAKDDEGNEYEIRSHLFGAGDARGTVAFRKE